MAVRHGLERDSNSSRTLVPIQIGHLFQGKPDRYSDTKSDSFAWLLGLGSARVENESVGVEGRYTTCQKGSVQMHKERNLYGTKNIIHASDQRNPPTEVSTSIIGASHRPQLRALSQHGGRLSPTRQGRRAELAFARRTERGAVVGATVGCGAVPKLQPNATAFARLAESASRTAPAQRHAPVGVAGIPPDPAPGLWL